MSSRSIDILQYDDLKYLADPSGQLAIANSEVLETLQDIAASEWQSPKIRGMARWDIRGLSLRFKTHVQASGGKRITVK